MKKFYFLLIALLCSATMAFAEDVEVSVHVSTPGTLAQEILNAGSRAAVVTKLTITGTLNEEDYRTMRETASLLYDIDLSGVTDTEMPSSAFSGKSSLKSIVLPESLTSIGRSAFYFCSSLTSITIPNSVTSIGYEAFSCCYSLTSITIPNSVTSIESSAFSYCGNLTSITIPNSVTEIGGCAFKGCSSLTSITIPNRVTCIGEEAFRGCSSLASITIPNSVTSIGDGAFEDCSSLTSITIPNSVTSIGDEAFYFCSSLTSITIPNSVTSIGYGAFVFCPLTDVTCYAGVPPTCGSDLFLSDVYSTATLTVPEVSKNDYVLTSPWDAFHNIETMDIDYYKITATSNDTEMGYVVGSKYYLPNDTVKLEAIPNFYNWAEAGGEIYYKFKQWSDGNTENPRVFVATEDVTLVAEFIIPPYEVTLTCDEAQGTVTGGGEYEQGTQVTITATAKEGYQFSHWTYWEYGNVYDNYENPYTFEMGSQNYYIEAVFEKAKTEIDGIYYYLNNDTASVTSPNENVYYGDIVIPETITVNGNTYIVSYIGGCAFCSSNITSVNIPATIKKIGCSAFDDCNSLQIVKFNSSTAPEPLVSGICGANSFFNFGYYNKKIIVPCGAIETYENAFGTSKYWYFTNEQYMLNVSANNENCYAEIQDNISCDDNEATIYASSYSDSHLFKQWSDGNTDNPRTVTVTSDTTFVAEFNHCYTIETYYNYEQGTATGSGKYTESDTAILVAIPNIGYEFDYWNVYIYNQYGGWYEYIGSTTGDTIKLTNLDNNYAYEAIFKVVPVLIDGIYYELKPNLTAYVYPHEYTGDIVIPSNVVYKDKNYDVAQIYEDAFTGTSITSLSVSNGLNSINLSGCDSLVALTGNIGFIEGCSGLNSLKGLKEIYVTSGTLATGDVVYFNFLNLLQIPTLEVLDLSKVENTELSPEMFKETYVDVFNEYYGGRLHLSLKNLRKLVLPEGLTMIHDRQFEGLWMLEEIVIPDGVTEIPDGAFYDCHALANIEFSKNLTSIGKYAFYSCHALENIVIPEGVTEIGDAAFYGCNYADEIVIASSVQRIGNNAFALCNQVERMEVHATIPPSIRAKTFYQVNRNIEFVVPAEARNAYAEDIYWREFIQEVPTDVETTTTNSLVVYTQGGMIYVEGVETDYNIFDASGRLVYLGRESVLSLPRGVYMVVVGDEVEKIVL